MRQFITGKCGFNELGIIISSNLSGLYSSERDKQMLYRLLRHLIFFALSP